MAVRQYIGARYMPIFGRRGETSTDWDNSAPYEPLTIVTYQGNSYTSRQAVPAGIDIDNEEYWIETANYSAQIEQYRQEVLAYNDRITTLEGNFPIATGSIANSAVTNPKIADGAITVSKIGSDAVTLSKIADGNVSFDKLTPSLQTRITNLEAPITSSRIDSEAVTVSKIATGAVTTSKIADGNVSFDKLTPTLQTRITNLEAPITSSRIDSEAVTVSKIATGAVTTSKIADGNVSFDKLTPTLQTRISQIEDNIRYMVVIGDSFSYSAGGYTETPYWWQYVERRCGLTAKVYAQGGTGYTVGSQTFAQQTDIAVADTTFNHANVEYCIVLGGVNDHGAYTNSNVNTVVQKLINEFTNAKTIVVFNTGRAREDSNSARYTVLDYLATAGVPHGSIACVENIDGAIKTSDSLHPTAAGSAMIANYIESLMGAGTFDCIKAAWNIPINISNGDFSITSKNIKVVGDTLYGVMRVQKAAGDDYGTCRLTFPTIIGQEYNGNFCRDMCRKVASVDGHANVISEGSYLIAQNSNCMTIDVNPAYANPDGVAQFNIDFRVKLI